MVLKIWHPIFLISANVVIHIIAYNVCTSGILKSCLSSIIIFVPNFWKEYSVPSRHVLQNANLSDYGIC